VDFRELRETFVTPDAECEKLAARLRESLNAGNPSAPGDVSERNR
jgi:hypothetical protein